MPTPDERNQHATPSAPTRARWALPLAIAVAGVLSYANAFHGEFVFDDVPEIVDQPLIRSLDNFVGSWEGYRLYPNRVLTYFTFALNYAVGGLDTTGYHAVNILLHIGTALLVYALVALTFQAPHLRRSALAPWRHTVAGVAGLLFVTHPLQTQAVAYVSQRLTSLSTCFYLLAVVLYARWRLQGDARRARGIRAGALYAGVLVAALAAMKSKEIALTLPVAIVLYEAAFLEGPWRPRLAWLVPILAMGLVIPIGIFGLHQPLGKVLSDASDMRLETDLSRAAYFATQLTVIVRYLRLLVLPAGQNLDYDYPLSHSLLELRVALSGVLLLALAGAAVAAWGASRRTRGDGRVDPAWRMVSFGLAWFFLGLALESSIFPIADVIFEHRVYLPSVGFFTAVATLGALVAQRVAPARAAQVTLTAGAIVAVVLGAATVARNRVWASDLALWTDVVKKSPGKSRPRDNLGLALAHLGREPEAIVEFREAVRANPRNVRAWGNLGVALMKTGQATESISAFMTALSIDPGNPEALYNVGRAKLDEGHFDQAAALFEEALKRKPTYAEAYANLAVAWNQLGRYSDTITLLERAALVVSRQPEAHFNLGVAYVATGNRAAAEREISVLSSMAPPLAAQLADYAAQRWPGR